VIMTTNKVKITLQHQRHQQLWMESIGL